MQSVLKFIIYTNDENILMNKRIVSFFFLLLFAGSLYAAIGITDLRTEQLKNPAGIDVRHPRLSWRIESDEQNVIQTAYHLSLIHI